MNYEPTCQNYFFNDIFINWNRSIYLKYHINVTNKVELKRKSNKLKKKRINIKLKYKILPFKKYFEITGLVGGT